MFKETPSDIIEILKTKNVTVNAHQFCIVDEVSSILCILYFDTTFAVHLCRVMMPDGLVVYKLS